MNAIAELLLAGLAAMLAVLGLTRRFEAPASGEPASGSAAPAPAPWLDPNGRCAQYLATFDAAERAYGLPAGLLARVAWQESRCRADIISGETVSSAGAVGLMQIVPRWHPGVDPTDPIASIWYAAQYLSRLRAQFGTWADALAAYNWGPGNLSRQGFDAAPAETVAYVRDVTRDVGLV